MEQIKFFKGPFSILPVMKLLKSKVTSYKLLCDTWEQFGYSLGLNKYEIDGLQEKLTSGRSEFEDIPRDILRLWKDGHEEEANLKVLHEALIDVKVGDLADAIRRDFGGEVATPPPAKRSRQRAPDVAVETVTLYDDENDFNVPDEDGDLPLLVAIREGQSFAKIQSMLIAGANPNVKSDDCDKDNAAHEVIRSLINKKQTIKGALMILNLLVSKGFTGINEADNDGYTPLMFAMQLKDLNEELLQWFHDNGAIFNSVEPNFGNPVLLQAIAKGRGAEVLLKIIEFGGDPKSVNWWKSNALHWSAMYANVSAMEIFIDKLGVNDRDEDNETPLHLLFSEKKLDYEDCLEMLLEKGADFGAKSKKGYVPLVRWMKHGAGNPFPTLTKTKDLLPITGEIGSATLTAIVEEMERLQEFLPSSGAQNDFTKFIAFLILVKVAKLRLKNEMGWKREKWGELEQIILTRQFSRELKTTGRMHWHGELIKINASVVGFLDFHTKSNSVPVPIEVVLLCLLASKRYKGFVELCKCLKKFCESVSTR